MAAAVPVAAATTEPSTKVKADRFLPADQMGGPSWSVAPEATNDGFDNLYTVTSRFGTWAARGKAQVVVRTRETAALAELEEVSKSEVFVDAVKDSVTAPLDLVASVATKPVETLKGIPQGVGRWFKKTSFRVKEGYHDAKEKSAEAKDDSTTGEAGKESEKKSDLEDEAKKAAKASALDYLKVSGAERQWYARLGVDPYTDNETLRKAVKSVARVEGLTKFGMKFAGMPSIPGASEIRKTMNLVWETDPWELRLRNRKLMTDAGLGEETARRFEDNPALSLTVQTALLDLVNELGGVGGRGTVIARAIDVESRDEATRLLSAVALMVRFHRQQEPLAEFLEGSLLPVAKTKSDKLVAVLLSDAVYWTEGMASAAGEFAAAYRDVRASERQLWLVGEASPAFQSGARELGWHVHDRWRLAAESGRAAKPGGGS